MYFNTDAPGTVQDTGKLPTEAAPAPENSIYDKTWGAKLPTNLTNRSTNRDARKPMGSLIAHGLHPSVVSRRRKTGGSDFRFLPQ